MKKVCFLVGDVSRSGGTERVTTVVASELARRNYDVFILSLANGRESFFPVYPGVRLQSLRMEGCSANLSDLLIWWRLRRFIKQNKIESLIAVDAVLSWYCIPAAWGTSARVISWEHFHLLINVGDSFQRVRRSLGRRLAVRWARKVVTLTERDRQQYQTNLPGRAEVLAIPNPFTVDHAQPSDLDSKIVLAAGRLVPQKGFDLLLDAWARAWPKSRQWKVRIVGSGADETQLKQQALTLGIQDGVEFVPNTSDMRSIYRQSALYACASRFEGLPLVLIEAKSFGLPVISFDCACGPSDIVRDGVDGLLVPAEDTGALARALERLINDEKERRAMGMRALEDRRFEVNEIVQAWERILA